MSRIILVFSLVLLSCFGNSIFAQESAQSTITKPNDAMFPAIVGGLCKEATIILEGKKGEEYTYSSTAQQAYLDLETHYFGMRGKLGMYKTANQAELQMANDVLDLNHYGMEFLPDNPTSQIVPLEAGKSVEVKVPGILWISNHKQPMTVNFTYSRDQQGKYHARGGFVVNLAGLDIKIPVKYQNQLNGTLRLNFSF